MRRRIKGSISNIEHSHLAHVRTAQLETKTSTCTDMGLSVFIRQDFPCLKFVVELLDFGA